MINNVVSFPQLPDPGAFKPVTETPQTAAPSPEGDVTQGAGTAQNAGSTQNAGQGAAVANAPSIAARDEQNGKPVESDLRLTIDKDPQSGQWIYKAIDRVTGKVVSELPQQSVSEMLKSESYQAGSVIDTEA